MGAQNWETSYNDQKRTLNRSEVRFDIYGPNILPNVIDVVPLERYRRHVFHWRWENMLPVISAALTVARAWRGLTIPEVAAMAGVEVDDVFDAENFLEDTAPVVVQLIAMVLDVDLTMVHTH